MDLARLAQLGEFIGGVAVVVTLIYLAAQVRQNNRWLSSVSVNEHIQRMVDIHLAFSSPESGRLTYLMVHDPDSLDEQEKARVTQLGMALFRSCQAGFHQHRSGLLPEHVWHGFHVNFRTVVALPWIAEFWNARGSMFDPEFRDWIEDLAASEGAVDFKATLNPFSEPREGAGS